MKQHTIIFVPHARARFRKLRVTNRQLAVIAAAILLCTFGSLFTTWSFFTNSIDRGELDRVQVENQELREVNQSFEDNIRELEKQLADFEQRTRRLAIVAGLDSLGGVEAGIGGESLPFAAGPDASLDRLQSRALALRDGLVAVESGLDERDRLISATPSIAPVAGILTSGYGLRRDPVTGQRAQHVGIDIATAPGRPVKAPADGIVVRTGRIGGLGKAVYVSHGYGVTTRYGHLSEILVHPGQRVRQTDVLGTVGSSGKSTGYHLHYEVRVDGQPQNPIGFMLDRGASS